MTFIIKEINTGKYFQSVDGDHFSSMQLVDQPEATRINEERYIAMGYCRKISRVIKQVRPNVTFKIQLVRLAA